MLLDSWQGLGHLPQVFESGIYSQAAQCMQVFLSNVALWTVL